MKLWRAMVLGSKLKPQCFGAYYRDGGSCVIGAVMDILGNDYTFPWLEKVDSAGCPVKSCDYKQMKYINDGIIPHLNDTHKWTREAIAEWVKTFEDDVTREKWNERKQLRKILKESADSSRTLFSKQKETPSEKRFSKRTTEHLNPNKKAQTSIHA